MGEKGRPIDTVDAAADYERERCAESQCAKDADAAESEERAIPRPRAKGAEREHRRREVEAGQPECERREQQLGHPHMITVLRARSALWASLLGSLWTSSGSLFLRRPLAYNWEVGTDRCENHPFGGFASCLRRLG